MVSLIYSLGSVQPLVYLSQCSVVRSGQVEVHFTPSCNSGATNYSH